jgi:outer membrane protein
MRHSRFPLIVLAVAMLLAALVSFSAAAADFKIGFVDRERILRESGAAKRAQAKLKKEFAAR